MCPGTRAHDPIQRLGRHKHLARGGFAGNQVGIDSAVEPQSHTAVRYVPSERQTVATARIQGLRQCVPTLLAPQRQKALDGLTHERPPLAAEISTACPHVCAYPGGGTGRTSDPRIAAAGDSTAYTADPL